jgi:secreted trypsin-like serine protease
LARDEDWGVTGWSSAEGGCGRFTVALRTRGVLASGGGALVAPRWVLTAAHCCSHVEVVLGVGRLDGAAPSRRVAWAFRHRDYDAASFAHDLALLELAEEAPGDPIALAANRDLEAPGSRLRLLGWRLDGGEASPVLRQRWVRALPGDAARWPSEGGRDVSRPPGTFCAVPATWPGDSGGPVVGEAGGRALLVGVIGRTGRGVQPDLHTSVAAHRDWIEGLIGGDVALGVRCLSNPLPASGS